MSITSNLKKLAALGVAAAVVGAAVACSGSGASHDRAPSGTSNGPAAAPKSIDSGGAGGTLEYSGDTSGVAPNAQVAGGGAGSVQSGSAAPSDGGALALPDVLGRKIVMVSTVSVGVKDVAGAFEDVQNIALVDGGFLASSSFGHQDDQETASVTIRVPSDKYQDALASVRKLGDVQTEESNSNDVTQDYTDLQSRLHSLQAALQQYLSFLNSAGDIGQVLQVQDRINQTQSDIEQTQGRINLLNNQTDLATITVHLAPVVPAKPEPKGGSRGAAGDGGRRVLALDRRAGGDRDGRAGGGGVLVVDRAAGRGRVCTWGGGSSRRTARRTLRQPKAEARKPTGRSA